MTFIQSLITEIEQNWTDAPVYFGTPAGATKEYIVMNIVTPLERPEVMCEEQGEAGEVLLQFSGVSSSFQAAYNMVEDLKDYVQTIYGTISHGTPDYRITANTTDGVRELDVGLNTWQLIFEARFRWAVIA